MKRNLPIELDFVYEAANADRVRQMFAHLPFLKVCWVFLFGDSLKTSMRYI